MPSRDGVLISANWSERRDLNSRPLARQVRYLAALRSDVELAFFNNSAKPLVRNKAFES
jgi:hypothetical protein